MSKPTKQKPKHLPLHIIFPCQFGSFMRGFNQRLMNMRDNSSTSNSRSNDIIQLLISSDGQLQMSWGNSLHLQIFTCISC